MKNLLKNRKKGFTLVELIVVIVIIAILIAALTPAILGVIRRANETADMADARLVMTTASLAGSALNPPGPMQIGADGVTAFNNALDGGGGGLRQGQYRVYFRGPVAVRAELQTGAGNTGTRGPNAMAVGVDPAPTGAGVTVRIITINAAGEASGVAAG